MFETPIEKLQLSARTYNSLKRAHIDTVGDVLHMSEEELLSIRNLTAKPLAELRQKLDEHGFTNPQSNK